MTELKDKTKKTYREEIAELIVSSGLNPNNDNDLNLFATLCGNKSVSASKLKLFLTSDIIPNEEFIFGLVRGISIIHGDEHYEKIGIQNQIQHEITRCFSSMGDEIKTGCLFPKSEMFRSREEIYDFKKYLSSIPDIFWDMSITLEEAISCYRRNFPNGENLQAKDNDMFLIHGTYNYVNDLLVPDQDCLIRPDVLRFRLFNSQELLRVKSIDSIRNSNNAKIYVVLQNGNFIELTNESEPINSLYRENYFNSGSVTCSDPFFCPDESLYDLVNMSNLKRQLMDEKLYSETYNKLTYRKY